MVKNIDYIKEATRNGNTYGVFGKNTQDSLLFRASGYQYYTMHKDKRVQQRYLARHHITEKWGVDGVEPPGFYSRWVLWNTPPCTIQIRYVDTRFILHYLNQ